MKTTVFVLLTTVSALLCPAAQQQLFNGKDLSNWTAVLDYGATGDYPAHEPTWFVSDGAIYTTGTPFGYLRTKKSDYRDFKLHVEYRWWRETPKPNSGVFVRIAKEHGTFLPTCAENQLCRGSAGDVLGLAGFPFEGISAPSAFDPAKPLSGISKAKRLARDSEKPFGEWNTLEVVLRGDTLVNTLNGQELNRLVGLPTKKGPIALQAEGGAVEFRNIWLEEDLQAAATLYNTIKGTLDTSLGKIEIELDLAKAPITVSNFVAYVKSGHYDGTIFHRVINGFMIQGGGFTGELIQKETREPIVNEAKNGLKNVRGTLAMARTSRVNSATCQFFINQRDNPLLDHTGDTADTFGYAVFGKVTKGMDVVDKIAEVRTGSRGYFTDMPLDPVVIKAITLEE